MLATCRCVLRDWQAPDDGLADRGVREGSSQPGHARARRAVWRRVRHCAVHSESVCPFARGQHRTCRRQVADVEARSPCIRLGDHATLRGSSSSSSSSSRSIWTVVYQVTSRWSASFSLFWGRTFDDKWHRIYWPVPVTHPTDLKHWQKHSQRNHYCLQIAVLFSEETIAPYRLRNHKSPWFIWRHINCLFVCLLYFFRHLSFFSLFFLYAFLWLIYFLTRLLPDLSIYSFQNRPVPFSGRRS